MNEEIVLISIFRETIIGGVAVHSSNLYERLHREGVKAVKVNYAPFFVRGAKAIDKITLLAKIGVRLLGLRLTGKKVYHFHASNRALIFHLYAWALYLSGGKIILSIHSGYGFDKYLAEHPFFARLNSISFRFLHWLIFMNEDESARIQKRYPFLVGRVMKINPFISPPAPRIPNLNVCRENDKVFRIATIGVWTQRYNSEEVIRAGLRFFERTGVPTEVQLLLSTVRVEEEYKRKLLSIIEEARKTIGVQLLEDRNDILEQLLRADVSVRPASMDSYGLCVAESLLVGTPAIATNVCSRCNRALLYEWGDVDQLTDQLVKVYESPKVKRASMLDATEDSFNWYISIYRELLGGVIPGKVEEVVIALDEKG